MKQLTEEEAKEELDSYQKIIATAFDKAVSKTHELGHPSFTKRTRAGMIRDLAVHNLKHDLKGVKDVKVLEKDNTVLFRFGESLIGRVKKLDKKYNASYNLTESSEKYTNQQYELFGNEYRLTSVHIGYVLDDFGVGIKNIIITCPVNSGKSSKWLFPLEISSTKQDVTLETNEEQNERFRVKSEIQKDKSKNDRTGTGGQGTNSN